MDATGSVPALRLTAVATHPIQYHAPWFRALAARGDVDLEVLFERLPDAHAQGEGFGRAFRWDVPLLDGYRWRALEPRGDVRVRWRVPALGRLGEALRERRPEVVLLTGWQSPLLLSAPWAARAAGARVLVRGEANLLRPRPGWKRAAQRALMRRYDGFLAIGSANRAFYLDSGVDAARIRDCPYFVDNDRFARSAAAVDRGAGRRRLGVPDDAVCLLFAGKLEAKKRPLDAIEALRRAGDSRLHLMVVGSGVLEGEARRAASGLPVHFAGFLNQSEIPAAYAAADCLVLPSDHGETWGLVVNEAMACGLPAIVSDQVGCAADLVTPGETGWVVPTGDVAALAAAFAEAARAPAALRAMGERARSRVTGEFTVARAAQAVVDAARAACATGAERGAA